MGVVLSASRKSRDHRQRLVHRHAAFQRALTGQLDRRAVGHRIGEGHAQFDHVHAGGGQALHDGQRGRVIGIAAHDIGDEGLLPCARSRAKVSSIRGHGRSP